MFGEHQTERLIEAIHRLTCVIERSHDEMPVLVLIAARAEALAKRIKSLAKALKKLDDATPSVKQ